MHLIFPGYPPADHEVRSVLTTQGTEAESYHRAYCFVDALFALFLSATGKISQFTSPGQDPLNRIIIGNPILIPTAVQGYFIWVAPCKYNCISHFRNNNYADTDTP
jgi:hypothetical protein